MVFLFMHVSSLLSSNLINIQRHFPQIRFMHCFQIAGYCIARERRVRQREQNLHLLFSGKSARTTQGALTHHVRLLLKNSN